MYTKFGRAQSKDRLRADGLRLFVQFYLPPFSSKFDVQHRINPLIVHCFLLQQFNQSFAAKDTQISSNSFVAEGSNELSPRTVFCTYSFWAFWVSPVVSRLPSHLLDKISALSVLLFWRTFGVHIFPDFLGLLSPQKQDLVTRKG